MVQRKILVPVIAPEEDLPDIECDLCKGTGECDNCGGAGELEHVCDCEYCTMYDEDCEYCGGTGHCEECEGVGFINE